jgi:CYTH domain-containing protein
MSMSKTAFTQYHRLFLVERLPEPLEAKSAHLQIFDNYIDGTRLRLRLIRDPATKNWTRILQQQIIVDETNLGPTKLAEIHLNESEYSNFEQFEGREIRKNRYFHEFDGVNFAFDVYLGDLWGLNTAGVEFDDKRSFENFDPPPFAIFEVTNDPFFFGKTLVGKTFDDVRSRVTQIAPNIPAQAVLSED